MRCYLKRLPVKIDFAILFGSTIYGERLRDSDIDLIVVSKDFEGMPFEERILILQKHWKHSVMLEAFGFTPTEFEKLKDKSIVVQEAVEKGKRILVRRNGKVAKAV
ncbi:nucleotidyltransferase domain-containing protein [Candidatus Bathyarchaeota archaeon]|nr:nucleotidyltransferase domain-containing protein [Candidatus Bathyarchaeota archaeon]